MAAEKKPRAAREPKPTPKRPLCTCCGAEIWNTDGARDLCNHCSSSRHALAETAMSTLVGQYDEAITPQLAATIADDSYVIADAMLRQRRRPYAYAGDPLPPAAEDES